MAGTGTFSTESPLFKVYLFWSTLLIVKMIVMAFLTGKARHSKKAFANPEDAKKNNASVVANDPDVERVRRAHLNDLENILPFLALCPLYLATGPSPWLATNLIRTFGIARAAHSFFYLNEMSARGLAYIAGTLVLLIMAGSVLLSCCA